MHLFPSRLFTFLLTPLREGRHADGDDCTQTPLISTHAPAGGATAADGPVGIRGLDFYSRPCGRGDGPSTAGSAKSADFYSRPCGRGDWPEWLSQIRPGNFYSRPCGRGDLRVVVIRSQLAHISTHAPAGGATAIFHKSVMRFCGKLPKDDTVLCLASFGFPRRDPKAVYLA